jgi:hypothetical protein
MKDVVLETRDMTTRPPGYYWIEWTERADAEFVGSRPGPLVGEWTGKVWWFTRLSACRFDCEVQVLGACVDPAQHPIIQQRGAA